MDTQELEALNREIDRITFGIARLDEGASVATGDAGFRRILLAVDGSKESEDATEWAGAVAAASGAKVTVVHIMPPPHVLVNDGFGYAWQHGGDLDAAATAEGERILDDAVGVLRKMGVEPERRVILGPPVYRIVQAAAEARADLVVMGSRGRSVGERLLIGSVTDGVKNHVAASVLIARAPPRVDRVLVPVDGSRASRRAAAVGLRLAREMRARPTLLHVVEPEFGRLEDDGFADASGSLAIPGDPHVGYRIATGRPASKIAETARDGGYGLIVMGSRGLGGFRSLVAGSVSNRVAHVAPVSVLLVKEAAP